MNVPATGAGLDSGFAAYQLADNGSGIQTGGDASLISRKVVGLSVPLVPSPPAGGPDPVLFLGTAFAQDGRPADLGALTPGQTVSVPVSVRVTERAGVSIGGATAGLLFSRVCNFCISE